MKKGFIVCYIMTIFTYYTDNQTILEKHRFLLDYFKRDEKGRFYLDLIADFWCIPFQRTNIEFTRF